MNSFFILKNRQDFTLLIIVILSIFYIIIYRIDFSSCIFINIQDVHLFLKNNGIGSVIESIAASIIAGYVVYIFVELLPRLNQAKGDARLLKSLSASVKIAFDDGFVFSHERPISRLKDINVKNDEELKNIKKDIYENKKNHLKLKLSMETAHSQMLSFSQALIVATKISPECALRWLDLTSAVHRFGLLYEEYSMLPKPDDDACEETKILKQENGNSREEIHSDMSDRFYQYNQAVLFWIKSLPKYVQ